MTATTKVWKPALNDVGRAKGTFTGIFVTERESANGSWDATEAVFEILGEDGKTKVIPLRLPSKYAETNAIGKLAKALGFNYNAVYETREDGFNLLKKDNLDELNQIFEENEGKEYTLKLSLNEKFLWDINPSSLKPLQA